MVLAWALCLGCVLLGVMIAAAIWSALPVSLQPPAADRIHRVLGGTLVSLGFLLCSGVGLLLGVRLSRAFLTPEEMKRLTRAPRSEDW